MDMYTDDLITREELNQKIGGDKSEIMRIESELAMIEGQALNSEKIKAILNNTFREIEDIVDLRKASNTQLKRIIEKIEVDKDGQVEIYLKALSNINSNKSICLCDDNRKFRWLLK